MDPNLLDNLGLEPLKLPWWQKMLMKFWPSMSMRFWAKKMNIENVVFDKLHEVFSSSKTIDLFPMNSPETGRGFILILDRETSLFFYQDGDHFKYDGFEMGPYEAGDVTIFDNLARK